MHLLIEIQNTWVVSDELKGEIGKYTFTVGNFNTPLSIIDEKVEKIISKSTENSKKSCHPVWPDTEHST